MKLNSHSFEDIYKKLAINLDKLGCIMLDVDGSEIKKYGGEGTFYYAKDKDKFWINGFVAGKTPHVTLLYGLLKTGLEWKDYVNEVLKGWDVKTVRIKDISFFESPYKEEPYYCIVGHVDITPELLEGHQRLSFLPHINTFPTYQAHITIAYVKKADVVRDDTIRYYKKTLQGKDLKVIGLNYGGNKA